MTIREIRARELENLSLRDSGEFARLYKSAANIHPGVPADGLRSAMIEVILNAELPPEKKPPA